MVAGRNPVLIGRDSMHDSRWPTWAWQFLSRARETAFPKPYLAEYYTRLDEENEALLAFFAEQYADLGHGSVLLDFGCGPTIYALISAAPHLHEAHLYDYRTENLDEIRLWLAGRASVVDWTPYFEFALRAEGCSARSDEVTKREQLVRSRVRLLGRCDAFSAAPLGSEGRQSYDIVVSNFCAECITDSRESWLGAVRNIFGLVRSGGKGMMCVIENATFYAVGGVQMTAVPITVDDVVQALICAGFDRSSVLIQRIGASKDRGYSGIIMAAGRKT